jgi:predicted lactoylglutathione lyase
VHVCLRVPTTAAVDAFHASALAAGGASDGGPGLRPHHGEGYYAAFIRDLDGNRIEAVTFLTRSP